jgi:predicted MFS family arabinose efflux permease
MSDIDETRGDGSAALAPLREPIYRAMWLATAASNFGSMVQTVGAAWLMISLAHAADMVALVQAAVALPMMLFALPAGAMADGFDRRTIMLTAQIAILAVAALLSLFSFAGCVTPAILLGFTFLLSTGTAFNAPAWQASVGDMVSRRQIASAVALNAIVFNVARSTGPAVGGAIVALGGAASAFGLNAVSSLGLIFVLARWRPERVPKHFPREPLFSAISVGLRYGTMSPGVRAVLLRGFAFGAASMAIPALLPVVARELLHGDAVTYGLLLGAFGVGAVIAALLSARLRTALSSEALVRWSSTGVMVAAAGAGLSRSLPLAMAVLALGGGGWLIAFATFNVTIQMLTPRWVVARVIALHQMTTFAGMAFGSWFWGHIAAREGLPAALLGSSAAMGVVALLGLRFALHPASEIDLDPLNSFTEPETAVPVDPKSGPIAITIEYRIVETDQAAFLAAVAAWSLVRRRDGAKQWSLFRDLHDPEIWVERYEVATWLDYLRHTQRFTMADSATRERLRGLHRGPQPPRMSRAIRFS